MSGRRTVVAYLSPDEVRMKVEMIGGSLKMRKWLVILNGIIDPRPVSEIALHTGLSESCVYRIIAQYNRLGPESIETQRT